MSLNIDWGQTQEPLDMRRFGVGQGGFSRDPMWADRVSEVRALKPRVIRFFLTEYFSDGSVIDWAALDAALQPIVDAKAIPLVCIVLKPESLFRPRDLRSVVPSDWDAWADLVRSVVEHCVSRWAGGWYWEIGNEPDLFSGGGAPYSFEPDEYVEYYRRTSVPVREADAEAHIGGPASGSWESPLMAYFVKSAVPASLDVQFVSWHAYQDDPQYFARSIRGMRELTQAAGLDVALVIDEWNMRLAVPRRHPGFQPAFIAETTLQFLDEGLDISSYYHIRDYPIDIEDYLRWYPRAFVRKEERFWDRRPVLLGLFDLQNTPRPAYSLMKLLSRLTGLRVPVTFSHPTPVRAIASRDDELGAAAALIWNYSDEPVSVTVGMNGIGSSMLLWQIDLVSSSPSAEDTERLFAHEPQGVSGAAEVELQLEPWGVSYLLLDLGLDVLSKTSNEMEGDA